MFSCKRDNENYPSLVFNDTKVQIANSQKHLGLILDFKLNFNEHIDSKINKCSKIIDIMIYEQPFNESYKRKIEMVRYKAALVITGAIKRARDRLSQELGLESLADG